MGNEITAGTATALAAPACTIDVGDVSASLIALIGGVGNGAVGANVKVKEAAGNVVPEQGMFGRAHTDADLLPFARSQRLRRGAAGG